MQEGRELCNFCYIYFTLEHHADNTRALTFLISGDTMHQRKHTRISPVRSRTVVQYEDTGEIVADGTQILRVGTQVWGTVLSVEAPLQYPPAGIQFVRHRRPVYFHAGREHDQLVPLRYLHGKQSLIFRKRSNFKRNSASKLNDAPSLIALVSFVHSLCQGRSRRGVVCARKSGRDACR